MQLPPLSLPPFAHEIVEQEGHLHIYDVLRKMPVRLTPEEWVRQHAVHYLLSLEYPKGLMRIEGGLRFNKMQKRSDLVVFDTFGKAFLLVECKAPHISLNQDVWTQAYTYNQTLGAAHIWITNGLSNHCWKQESGQAYAPLSKLPIFPKA